MGVRRIRVRRGSLGTLLLAAGGFALGGGVAEATFRIHEASGPPVGVGRPALSALTEPGTSTSTAAPASDDGEGLPARAALGVDDTSSTAATSTTSSSATSATRAAAARPSRTAAPRRTAVATRRTAVTRTAPRRTTATAPKPTAQPAPKPTAARPPAVGTSGS